MGYTVEKHYTEIFNVQSVADNFMEYGYFNRVRQDVQECGLCDHKFENDDMLNLAFIEGKKNQLICTECTKKAKDGGVVVTGWGKGTKS